MASVDDIIVAMQFDNSRFEAAARISMATLTQLKATLNFGSAPNGIDAAQKSAEGFNTTSAQSQVDAFSAKFMALSTVAITALSNITNKVVDTGLAMAKSLTLDPIMEGFGEYETKIGSIQTIFANTRKNYKDDASALKEINASLDELNTYADDTIYNFGDMTKNIGLFTNAGIGVKDATAMIKGFSNEAAASGTTSAAAAGAAYQLSQAMSAGVVTLMDWKSLQTVGMGNDNMEQGIIQIAEAMGAFEGTAMTAKEASENFNASLEKKWLTADVMENYLKIQAEGNEDVSRAMMKQIGLSKEQQDAFISQQKVSEDAARKVRTWTQLVGTLREAAGSTWAKTAEILLGDFETATTLFTGIHQALEPMVIGFGTSMNELLEGWADIGGREIALEGLKNIFEGLLGVLRPIKDAFKEIFPPTTVASLMSMTIAFRDFTERLKVGGETADKIKRTFAGVFAIFGIGWTIVKAIIGVFLDLFSAVTGGSGGFLSITANLGDFLVKVHEGLKNSEAFKNFFATLGAVLAVPIKLFAALAGGVGDFMMKLGNLGGVVAQVYGILAKGDFRGGPFDEDSKFVAVLFRIREALEWVNGALSQFYNILAKGDFVSGPFEEDSPLVAGLFRFRDMLKDTFSPENVSMLFGAGSIAAIAYGLKTVFKKAVDKFTGEDGGILGELKDAFTSIKNAFNGVADVFDTLTSALKTMQMDIKANIILKIAIAVGILALAMKLMSTLDGEGLAKSLGGITIAVTTLMGTLTAISKMAGLPGIVNMPTIALALIGLAAAILILSLAMKVMGSMSWNELIKGLVGTGVALALLVQAAKGLDEAKGPLIRAGLAMIPIAIGLRILASAVKAFGEMSWNELVKGLLGLVLTLQILASTLKQMPKNLPSIGFGLILVGLGVGAISAAVKNLGEMPLGEMVKGIVGLGAALIIIAGALHLMPKNLPAMGLQMLLLGVGLSVITGSVMAMGSMSWGDLVKGLVGLAGALVILSIGLHAMSGAMAGALALTVAAAGLTLLMIPLSMMAAMSWQEVLTGLGMLASVFTILGVAGYLLTPVVPIIIGLGIALAAMGIGLLAVGAAAFMFALALQAIINVVMLGQQAVIALMTFLPQLAVALANAITAFITTIAANTGAIMAAFATLLGGLLDKVIELIPKISEVISKLLTEILNLIIEHAPQIGEAFKTLILTFLDVVTTVAPEIYNAGFELIIGFLKVIRDRVPEMAAIATDIIVAFINTIAENTDRVVQAGFDMIIDVMHGLADAIRQNMPLVIDAAADIGDAIIDGIVNAISNGMGRLIDKAKNLASSALNAAKAVLGVDSPSKEFYKIGAWVVDGFVNGINSKESSATKTASNFATGFLNGFAKGVGEQLPKVLDSFFEILEKGTKDAVISTRQMKDGFNSLSGAVWQAELAMAEFHGQVNRADPKSVKEYSEKSGGSLKYLRGVIDGVTASAKEMSNQLANGQTLDKVLGSESFLESILDAALSVGSMFGVEGMLISAAIKLGLAVGDGLLAIFMGPGNTILGTVGGWITKLVRAVGGWFGIKFPVEEELKEGDKALQDFMVNVDDSHGRFEKLTEEAVKSLTDQMNEADDLSKGLDKAAPTVRPILDLNGWNKQINDFLDKLNTGPVLLNGIINGLFGKNSFFNNTIESIRKLFNPKPTQSTVNNNVTFNQTNTSPESLSAVEIYRNTNSQLSLAREELSLT